MNSVLNEGKMSIKATVILPIALTICVQAAVQARPMNDSLQAESDELAKRNHITFDIGLSPPGNDYEAGWGAYPSLRAGYGKILSKDLLVSAYFDYYRYHLSHGYGNSGPGPASAKRVDYAVYVTVRLGGILVLGSGIYLTKSDSTYVSGPSITTPYPWGGGVSGVRFFWIFGAEYDFKPVSGIFVPVGLYVRQSYGDKYGPIFLRVGLGMNF